MANKPRNSRKPAASVQVEGPQPFANGFEMGNEIGSTSHVSSTVALRMRASLGNAYDVTNGLPPFKKLAETIEKFGLGFTMEGIRNGLNRRWDSMWIDGMPVNRSTSDQYKALLARVGVESAHSFGSLSPQGKAALGKGDPARAEAVRELTVILQRFHSNSWGNVVKADDAIAGRVKARGRRDAADVDSMLKNTPIKALPERIVYLMSEKGGGHEVSDWWKNLAKAIVKAGMGVITKKK